MLLMVKRWCGVPYIKSWHVNVPLGGTSWHGCQDSPPPSPGSALWTISTLIGSGTAVSTLARCLPCTALDHHGSFDKGKTGGRSKRSLVWDNVRVLCN